MEFIIAKNQINEPLLEPDKIEIINDQFEIWYYDEGRLPPVSVGVNSYSGIPKCLAVIGTEGLEKSGVFRLQNEFNPGLFGNGVYVAVIDTGVNFALPSFIRNNGTSKVAVLWDQENEQVYDNSQINAAIRTDDPYEIIPAQDEDGHGTFIAGIICGQENRENDFTGIAPEAQLIVIKLKPAEKELKDFFFIPDEKLVFSEADIMRGIAFAERYASQNNRPMVVCLALGCNNGSHNGTENLCEYIDGITSKRGRTVVVGAGNEANARHHYQGSTTAKPANVEINVEKDMRGMYVECWSLAPELFTISIISPGGQSNPSGIPVQPQSGKYDFLLEGTKVTIDYRRTGRSTRDLLAFIRMENVVKGVWTIRFYPVKTINGIFHLWLPMNNMLEGDVTFIVSDPQTTITMPSDAKAVITAGGYNSINDSIYIESGRGFDSDGFYKPDLAAPAVNISGVDTRGNYILSSGTSAAAAITAGVCALGLELFTNKMPEDSTNGLDIKNALIRDCRRKDGTDYPNQTTGYGYLNGIANL
ncbi:MAG: S8 family peptidase [Agathobacter sp.]|nr:S8 family peptidase [uncultured Agathobacter sp.]MEE1034827.1 S8 family peptidase [Agathobacter sp.]